MPGTQTGSSGAREAAVVAERLRGLAVRLGRQLRQQQPPGLSVTLHSALSTIERSGGLSIGRLAEVECLPSSAATRVADRLEEAGLVERRRNPSDRRGVNVAVTAEGRRLVRRRRREASAWLAARLEQLSAAQLARIAETLELLEQLVLAESAEQGVEANGVSSRPEP